MAAQNAISSLCEGAPESSQVEHLETPGNTGRNTEGKARAWFITWNGYDEDSIEQLEQLLKGCSKYAVQEEIGDSGNRHLQGNFYTKSPRTMKSICKALPGCHVERTKNPFASFQYCQKEKTRAPGGKQWIGGLPVPVQDPLLGKDLHPWQAELVEIFSGVADSRTVHWYWEPTGNAGKTTFAKHICVNNNEAIYLGGKAADMKYAIGQMERPPKIILIDCPRTQEQFVSYAGIEEIKNGIFFSGKYEGKMIMFDPPHLVVLANFPPCEHKMSLDRWNVVCIADKK